ncbi:MAG: methyl-accepting chemotaxis protein, partial [Burkholderiaceae bacterium]|nr:methyl-accepting chemotaxis protein [Burkholderiaceae bacterium]
ATEVRNLAQRSAAAAKEIKALISDSVEKVGSGSKLVDQAGRTMAEVVGAIRRVTDIVGEITAASQEQSAGIEQVNQAVTRMDETTQQNAALVEEAAAAAESLEEQAGVLSSAVAKFRLDEQAVSASVPAGAYPAVERRGQNRAKNVARLPAGAAKAGARPAVKLPAPPKSATGTDDEWAEF